MGQFVKLIGIKIEHGYYKDVTDKFCIVPTAKTEALMRNRGIQFRRTGNGGQWLMAENCNGFLPDDRLECTLQVRDADFMYVTQLDDYRPQSFYRLDLSDENRITDVVSALVPVSDTAGASCFCNINICLTPDMLKEAKNGTPFEYTLGFRTAAFRWEYLFVRRNDDAQESKVLLLKDTKGKILFSLPKKLMNTPYGEIAWQIVSTSPVVCRQHPDCELVLTEVTVKELGEKFIEKFIEKLKSQERLILELEEDIQSGKFSRLTAETVSETISDKSLKRKTLSRFIPCPQPGRFKSEERDCIRHVCYI